MSKERSLFLCRLHKNKRDLLVKSIKLSLYIVNFNIITRIYLDYPSEINNINTNIINKE